MSATSWSRRRAVTPARKRTRHLLLTAVVVLGLFSGTVVCEKSKKYQMTDICKKYFLRDLYRKIDGAVLTSQNERDLNCAITFQTHSILQRFMLRFDQLHLDCNDHLYIYDGAHAVGSYKRSIPPSRPPRSDTSINDPTPTRDAQVFARLSIMTRRVSLVRVFVYVTLAAAIVAADQEACDKTKCPGPLMYYNLLGCKPIYDKEGDCCATKYDCDHLNERATDKCYVNGKEYAVGDKLKDEDRNACDIGCVCRMGYEGHAAFTCAVVDCFSVPRPGCYRRKSPLQCCPGEEICLEKPEDVPTCVVNGKTYKDGEYFKVEDDPELNCICQPGYEGKNVEPFCAKPKHPYCSPDFRDTYGIRQKCAPVYYSNQSPRTDCNLSTRCQNINDTVIHNHDDLKSAETPNEDNVCLFGNLRMHLGDELNQATDYSSVCVKCVCEVPPTPTCQRLPDEECDVTKHPPFEH